MARVICLSGAGLSADSGLATFRGADGLWNNHRVDQVCNYSRWKANFDVVHRFYNDLRTGLASVEPNAMHRLLASWQDRFETVLITQNVDDLLERAGARDVLHLHGRLEEMLCVACGNVWNIGHRAYHAMEETCPTCPCRKGVKPNVVFFGERAPAYLELGRVLKSVTPEDVFVVIGTDGRVVPVGAIVAGLKCRKVMNNLEPVPESEWLPGMVHESLFNRAIFRPAVDAVEELDEIVSTWAAEANDTPSAVA